MKLESAATSLNLNFFAHCDDDSSKENIYENSGEESSSITLACCQDCWFGDHGCEVETSPDST